jgi:simple sugar transport system ATP-binding protein
MIGLVLPDSGTISIDGERARLLDPLDAAKHGIGMVHQHFSLVEPLRVWENVALGDGGALKPGQVRDRVAEISERYGLHVDPDAVVGELPVGMRQRVEIIKCLRRDPSIIVFDEPTSVLTPDESEQLFATLRHVVTAENRAVALVSHKLDEILHATDEVTIMRQGCVVEHTATSAVDAAYLAEAMVGRVVSLRSERVALGVVDTPEGVDARPARQPVGLAQVCRFDQVHRSLLHHS